METLTRFERDANNNLTYAPFEANGKTFRFIKPGGSIGIEKYKHYSDLKIIVGSGVAFPDLISGIMAHQSLLASDQPFSKIRTEAIVWADSMIKGLIDMSKTRYDKAFYLCSIFIYYDGDDPYKWDYDLAERMIQDWIAGGVDEQDLFFFAMQCVPGWSGILSELQADAQSEAERNAARSLVGILLSRREQDC